MPSRPQLIKVINTLPSDVLPELADFISYLQFKITQPEDSQNAKSGSNFLLSIAGLGEAEPDWSERTEQILEEEIDSVRGFTLTPIN